VTIPNNPLVVLGMDHPQPNRPVSMRIKLLRHLHDDVTGHIYGWQWIINAFVCHCGTAWMPDIGRDDVPPGADWVRWPTKLDHFRPY
jgi:hypothetical protein